MKVHGSCHCGKVAFEAEGDFGSAMACNCSMCGRKGSLLAFVPRSSFKLLTPESETRGYLFNKHVIDHRFCTTCGIHPFAFGVDPKGNAMAAINVRCLEDFDLDAVKVTRYDGRSK
jgi:hypothetical protein